MKKKILIRYLQHLLSQQTFELKSNKKEICLPDFLNLASVGDSSISVHQDTRERKNK